MRAATRSVHARLAPSVPSGSLASMRAVVLRITARPVPRLLRAALTGVVAFAGALATLPRDAGAQSTATFDVVAYVPQPALIGGDRALAFGRVKLGQAVTIAHDDASGRGGQFTLTGAGCAQADFRFTLPSQLTATAPDGTVTTMAVDTWTADWLGGAGASQTFTPSASPLRVQFDHAGQSCGGTSWLYAEDENGQIRVRVGATVRAAANQAGGAYSGVITLSVAYVDL